MNRFSGSKKHIAPVSPGLLARKGQARPAMRPHGVAEPGAALHDLGWNDMGDPADVVPLVPAASGAVGTPPVAAVPAGELARIGRKLAARPGKSAFTLRLDAERHLRLRLASAIEGRSAQAIVMQALDQYLETLANLDALAAQVRRGDEQG